MRYFVECSFLYHRKFRWNPLWYEKELRAGSHCGGRVICRRSDPPQAENPVKQDSFLYIYRDTKNDEKLR